MHPTRSVRPFEVVSDFRPAGDQPAAIEALADGVHCGERFQTLLGITGSGKSATIAWTIEQVQRPTLVLAPNKSLAAQLANEFRELMPERELYILRRFEFYAAASAPDVGLVIASAERRVYANLLLTIGVVPPELSAR